MSGKGLNAAISAGEAYSDIGLDLHLDRDLDFAEGDAKLNIPSNQPLITLNPTLLILRTGCVSNGKLTTHRYPNHDHPVQDLPHLP